MTDIRKITEDEAAKMALEGDTIILGGVEVHVRSVRYKGDPGIRIDYTPPFGPDDCPDWMEDINNQPYRTLPVKGDEPERPCPEAPAFCRPEGCREGPDDLPARM